MAMSAQAQTWQLPSGERVQRPGARDVMIANRDAMPGSLQRMVADFND